MSRTLRSLDELLAHCEKQDTEAVDRVQGPQNLATTISAPPTFQLRMTRWTLALESGLKDEVDWALEELCQVCFDRELLLDLEPALTDALLDRLASFLRDLSTGSRTDTPAAMSRRRRAGQSLQVLLYAALRPRNAEHLLEHACTVRFILYALYTLDLDLQANETFVLQTLHLLHSISTQEESIEFPENPIPALVHIAVSRPSPALQSAVFATLAAILARPEHATLWFPYPPALPAALECVWFSSDSTLIDSCVQYFRALFSHPATADTFLLHPVMPILLSRLLKITLREQARAWAPSSTVSDALLCIYSLFVAAFKPSYTPRFDEDHFGFPGLVDDSTPARDRGRSTTRSRRLYHAARRLGAPVSARQMLEGLGRRDGASGIERRWLGKWVDALSSVHTVLHGYLYLSS
ncbi:RFX-type winged-helix domain-containing protein [Mycena sanguinolenta]|uniref:RFX-type winged-helix domain-containing protein n=1 Tax=Mycena sanguinolenta TaxID=230812 RepID=A0A8H7CUU3_9AGAR|nr:RFX-type winged-helix domain-containing protein [Mycena sanguinolenta]